MSIYTDTTKSMPAVTTLDQIRYVQGQINLLGRRRADHTHSTADQEKIDHLRADLDKLNKQYTAECLQQRLDNLYKHTRTS